MAYAGAQPCGKNYGSGSSYHVHGWTEDYWHWLDYDSQLLRTSVLLGIPEGTTDGTVNLDKYEGDEILYVSDLKIDPEQLKSRSTVTFKVNKGEPVE